MNNKKFILISGEEIYPGYLDKEHREQLKFRFGKTREYMKCACNPDKNMYYRISDDLKIYPEHNNYIHEKSCCRYRDIDGRQSAYVVSDEDGEVTAYLTFDPKSFSISDEVIEKEQDNKVPEETSEELEELVVEKDENEVKTEERKEPKLSLDELIRSINVDSYTEKILNKRAVESKEYFSKIVYYRMKNVRLNRMRKSLGDLTLEKDGVRFIYLPFVEAIDTSVSEMRRCYIKTMAPDGKIYSNFIYPKTLDKELKKFRKTYGQEPDQNTMIAGFQYLKKTKRKKGYRVLGRIHLFQASEIGLYCRNEAERTAFNDITRIVKSDKSIRFLELPEEEGISGIVEIEGFKKKILLVSKRKKNERICISLSDYIPYVIDKETVITKDELYRIIEENS